MIKNAFFKNKKLQIIGLALFLAGLFFVFNVSPVFAACEKSEGNFSFSKFLNPVASLAEKVVKDFGYDVVLAASPDPDFCGSDSVSCSGTIPTATISWTAAPDSLNVLIPQLNYFHPFFHYILSVSGVGTYTIAGTGNYQQNSLNTSYTVSSGLANSITYSWSVEAYYRDSHYGDIYSSASRGATDQPYGSFTTSNCAPALPTCTSSFNKTPINFNDWTQIVWNFTNVASYNTTCTGNLTPASGTNPPSSKLSEYLYPQTTQTCNTTVYNSANQSGTCSATVTVIPAYTYSWQTGSWGSCSSCSQTRSVWCQRSDGTTVADSYCSGTKPATSQSCGLVTSGCGASLNSCTAGTLSDTADGACTNNWNCVGSCGGTTASCSTNIANNTPCGSDGSCSQTGSSCSGTKTRPVCSSGTCNSSNTISCTMPNNTTCNDSDSCTINDKCTSGACFGTNNCSCTPNSTRACGSGACAGTQTCASNGSGWGVCSSNGASCSDSNSCTSPDTCQSGSCSSGPNNPVNGGWSPLSPSTCPSSCSQTRTCTYPAPACGGANCPSCSGSGCPNTNTQSCTGGACVPPCPLPTTPSLVSPASGFNIGTAPQTPTFQWTDSTGETGYYVDLCTDSSCNSYTNKGPLSANTTQTTWSSSLSAGTYWWRVYAYNTCGGVHSAIRSFIVGAVVVTPKYKCSGTSCIQDNTNGTYTTSNCNNACTPRYKCSGTSCVRNDTNGTYTTSNCNNACGGPPSYLLTVTKNGTCPPGSSWVTSFSYVYPPPTEIDCGAICSASYPYGTTVYLGAIPNSGCVFAGFSSNCEALGGPACRVWTTANITVTATFNLVVCTDTTWSPNTSTVCSGTTFTQTSNCGNTRSAVGTNPNSPPCVCTDTTWSPNTSTVCSGTTFTQTSNCGNTRTSTGTKNCADFSLNSSNSIYATVLRDQPGDSSATTLTIAPFNGFSSNVSLSVQSVSPSLPAGSTYNFSRTSLNQSQYSSGSQFSVHIGAGLSASQTYNITIKAVDGGLVRTTNVLLNAQVQNPNWREI